MFSVWKKRKEIIWKILKGGGIISLLLLLCSCLKQLPGNQIIMHYKKYHFVCCWILLMLSCSLIMQYIHISSCPCLCTCTSFSCSCHVIISVCFMFAFIIHLFYQFLCVQWSEKSSHKKKLIINLFTSIGNGNINTNFNYDFFFFCKI